MLRTFIATLALLTWVNPAAGMLRGTNLDELTRRAALIVRGRVTRVESVHGVRIAHLQVERTLKGEATADAYFVADPSWSCDISDANKGERGLYFLSVHHFSMDPVPPVDPSSGEVYIGGYQEAVGFRESMKAMAQGRPLYDVTHSGCGRFVVHTVDGLESLMFSHVALPATVQARKLPECTSSFKDAAPVSNIIDYVIQQVVELEGRGSIDSRTPN